MYYRYTLLWRVHMKEQCGYYIYPYYQIPTHTPMRVTFFLKHWENIVKNVDNSTELTGFKFLTWAPFKTSLSHYFFISKMTDDYLHNNHLSFLFFQKES